MSNSSGGVLIFLSSLLFQAISIGVPVMIVSVVSGGRQMTSRVVATII